MAVVVSTWPTKEQVDLRRYPLRRRGCLGAFDDEYLTVREWLEELHRDGGNPRRLIGLLRSDHLRGRRIMNRDGFEAQLDLIAREAAHLLETVAGEHSD